MAIKKEELYHKLIPTWIDSCIRSFAYIIGAGQIKTFLRGATESYMGNFMEYMKSQGIEVGKPSSVEDGVKVVESTLNECGLYDGDEIGYDRDKLKFKECIYADMCGEILYELMSSGKFTKKQLPCIRSDEVIAYLTMSLDVKARYDMESFQPGTKCVSKLDII